MRIRDVMGPSMGGADAGETLRDAWARLEALNLDPLPVVEEGKVVGVLRREEIRKRLSIQGIAAGSEPVRDIMEPPSGLPRTDEDIDHALRRLDQTENQSERLPVLDGEARLVGVVAMRQMRSHDPDARDGVTAVQAVESVDNLVSYDEDPVDYEIDGSFPASDPPSESSAGVAGPTRPVDTT